MRKYKDLTGEVFSFLTVIKEVIHNGNGKKWLCKCSCGNEKIVDSGNLNSGSIKSCGCYRVRRLKKHGCSNGGHVLYPTWLAIRKRCNNKNYENFNDYGGRGIKVCERWNDFVIFASDMGDRPENHSIDRIDNNGNYEPSNCKWSTQKEQVDNRRNTLVTIEGQTKPFKEWCAINGVNYGTATNRYSMFKWCKPCSCSLPVGKKLGCEH